MALSSLPSQSHLKRLSGPPSASHLSTFRSFGLNLKTFGRYNLHTKHSNISKFLRVKMGYTESTLQKDANSSISLPPLPEQRIVVGCGTVATDYLATVAAFPKPDEKIRSTNLQVQGGGNVGNALTGAARLGLCPRIISKVANDAPGRGILAELEADGVNTSYIVVSETGNSPFTYVIVDEQTKTRTCIHSPGSPPMIPEDLSAESLSSVLTGARIVYFDGRLPDIAHIVAKEASERQLPIFVDAERLREGLDELLNVATYVVCSANFPQVGSLKAPGIGSVAGRLLIGTAEAIPPADLVDTTGAGDGFIGAVLYAIAAGMPPENMLPFAARVAAAGCRALGARSGLPHRSDLRLTPYLV
ncbi:uncharacterized protein LOC131057390 isoform X8 [Cryptomeria japonica]|uniref:uncharacterized protein LOC131057390 isoform X8 n=1 Tax=Cryptomeria japonica TaxID=3369 RepID=UPI0027DA5AB5|nr:uncharacterized protein LOC131057390 isoform X8 [Cryptomeria japonica]